MSPGDGFTLSVDAEDVVGNTDSESKTFTYDDGYDASTPEFSVQDADDDNNIRMDDEDQDKDITVAVSGEDEDAPVQITCFVGGDEVYQTKFESVDSDGTEYTCEIPGEDYSGSSEEIYVEACDQAGHCESSEERTYSFDYSNPVVGSFETKQSYNVFNSNFDVSYEASDEASGIEEMEYSLSPTTMPGNGNTVNFDENEGSFTVDTSSLSRGEHTVYFRVRDGVDRWSNVASLDFKFYPNELPSLSVSADERLNITAGSAENLATQVENTGQLFIGTANITVSGAQFADKTQELSNIAPDDSIPVDFRLNPNTSHIGLHTLSVESEEPPASTQVEVLVEANSEQENEVESKVSNLTSKLESLENNISNLRNSGLSSDLNSTLSENVSDFITSVRKAEEYVEQGDHYKAMNEFEGISEKYEIARQSYSNVKEEHELNKRNVMIRGFMALFFIGVIGGGAFLYTREDYEVDLSEYKLPESGAIKLDFDLSDEVDSIKEFIKEEEEEVEEGFEGFR